MKNSDKIRKMEMMQTVGARSIMLFGVVSTGTK
jgi:hypothetical protein